MRGESSDISALRVVRNNTTVYDWSFIQQCPSSCEINCLALVHIWRMFQLPCSSIKDSIIFDTQRVPNAYINYITAVISTVCKRRSCRVILTPTTVPGSHGSIIIPFHCWKLNLTFPAIKKNLPKTAVYLFYEVGCPDWLWRKNAFKVVRIFNCPAVEWHPKTLFLVKLLEPRFSALGNELGRNFLYSAGKCNVNWDAFCWSLGFQPPPLNTFYCANKLILWIWDSLSCSWFLLCLSEVFLVSSHR